MTHFDMSIWSFEKLASSLSLGVIGIEYRRVPCDYQSSNPAPALDSPSPAEQPWTGAKRPDEMTLVRRFDSVGGPQDAVAQIDDPSQAGDREMVPISTMFQGADVDEVLSGEQAAASSSSSSSSDDNGCTDNAPSVSSFEVDILFLGGVTPFKNIIHSKTLTNPFNSP